MYLVMDGARYRAAIARSADSGENYFLTLSKTNALLAAGQATKKLKRLR